jgi:hypothetical protein
VIKKFKYKLTVWILKALGAGCISPGTARFLGRKLQLKGF